jgi:ribonuclease VapC
MVIDTSALFAIEFAEPERAAFIAAIQAAPLRLMSTATAVECAAVFAGRRPNVDPITIFDDHVRELEIEILPLDDAQWRMAAAALGRFGKGRHPAKLSFGDSFAYALARVSGEPLLFKGEDFALTDVARAI